MPVDQQAPDSEFLANLLRQGSRAFAAHATEILLTRSPETSKRFGSRGFSNWQDSLAHRVHELAAAVTSGAPAVFAADVRWSRAAFQARGVPVEDLAASIAALREACAEEIAPAHARGLDEYFDAAALALDESASDPGPRLDPEHPSHALAIAYLDAATSGDQRAAIRLLTDAQDRGVPVHELFCDVLLPAQVEIGTLWHLGEMSVVGEHVATEMTRSAISILASRAKLAEPRGQTVLVGAVAGDRHDIGVRATSDLLSIHGYQSICLGADVPASDFLLASREFNADAVVISAAMSLHLPAVKASIAALQTLDSPPYAIVGGNAFTDSPGLAGQLGASGYAASPQDAVSLLDARAANPRTAP